MTAQVKPNPTAAAKTVSFNITYPNSCSLKYDEIGLKLRDAGNLGHRAQGAGKRRARRLKFRLARADFCVMEEN